MLEVCGLFSDYDCLVNRTRSDGESVLMQHLDPSFRYHRFGLNLSNERPLAAGQIGDVVAYIWEPMVHVFSCSRVVLGDGIRSKQHFSPSISPRTEFFTLISTASRNLDLVSK